jgi:hypothetical protein
VPSVDVQSCKTVDGPTGVGHVTVTFAPSGEAVSVVQDVPPFKGTAVGECVSSRFLGVRVLPFTGGSVKLGKSFVIN